MGYRHMRRARCGGVAHKAIPPPEPHQTLWAIGTCGVRGAGAWLVKPSPRPSRRNIVCLILYMSLIVVNID